MEEKKEASPNVRPVRKEVDIGELKKALGEALQKGIKSIENHQESKTGE